MKTIKQMAIMERQLGKLLEDRIAEEYRDRIVIPNAGNGFFEKIKNELAESGKMLNFQPILKDGVFVRQYDKVEDYLIFTIFTPEEMEEAEAIVAGWLAKETKKETEEVDKKQNQEIQHLDTRQRIFGAELEAAQKFYNKDEILWSYSCSIDVYRDAATSDISIEYNNFTTAKEMIASKQHRKYSYVQKAKDIEMYTGNLNSFLLSMAWLNYISEHPEIKVVESKKTEKDTKQKTEDLPGVSANNQKPVKPHEIVLNGVKIVTAKESIAKEIFSKKRQRFVETWTVRGHYRHYASGKTIYIKPYEKGKTNGKRAVKTYIAK